MTLETTEQTEPSPTGEMVVSAAERERIEATLGRLDALARLMDDQFELPVVGYRIGLDPIIGVIPGGGDWATWIVGVYIFWKSLLLDTPRALLARMAGNLLVDLVVGYVPGLGDVFDAAFKANRRNVDLLFAHYGVHRGDQAPRLPADLPAHLEEQSRRSKVLRYLLGGLVVLVLFAAAALPIAVLWWLLSG